MGWIALADAYVGVIILEAFIPSLPGKDLPCAKRARKAILASLGVLAIFLWECW